MSDLRIKASFINAGYEEEAVEGMSRDQLLQHMAQVTLTKLAPARPPLSPAAAPVSGLGPEQF